MRQQDLDLEHKKTIKKKKKKKKGKGTTFFLGHLKMVLYFLVNTDFYSQKFAHCRITAQ